MTFSPNSFYQNINAKSGLARTSRFQVMLPIPTYIGKFVGQNILEQLVNLPTVLYNSITDIFNGTNATDPQSVSSNGDISRYLSLQCDTAELPGKTILTQDVKIYGPTFKVPYQTQYQDITLSFLCTNDFYERKLFDRWLESIMPTDTNNLRFPKDESTRYMTNITIMQYDEFIKQIYAVKLIDAFPTGVASQSLSWSEEGFHKVAVQFAYQKYETVYSSKTDVVAAYAEILSNKWGSNISNDLNNSLNGSLSKIF